MHCTSQSLLRGAFAAALRQPATTPPAFLAPAALLQQAAPFSTTAALARKRRRGRPDANPARGTSALRHTGMNTYKQPLSVKLENLPQPVLDPEQRSIVDVDPEHGLWGFFNASKEALEPPTTVVAHGRAWSVPELRLHGFEDLHRLWWVCVKELNRLYTMEAERKRLKAGYGEYESEQRVKTVRTTMKRIKFTLTERYYAWEDARWAAMEDPSIDLYADGKEVYNAEKDVAAEDAFEKAEPSAEADSQTERTPYVPPGSGSPAGGQEARV